MLYCLKIMYTNHAIGHIKTGPHQNGGAVFKHLPSSLERESLSSSSMSLQRELIECSLFSMVTMVTAYCLFWGTASVNIMMFIS